MNDILSVDEYDSFSFTYFSYFFILKMNEFVFVEVCSHILYIPILADYKNLVALVSNLMEFSSKKISSAVQNNNCNDSFPGLGLICKSSCSYTY